MLSWGTKPRATKEEREQRKRETMDSLREALKKEQELHVSQEDARISRKKQIQTAKLERKRSTMEELQKALAREKELQNRLMSGIRRTQEEKLNMKRSTMEDLSAAMEKERESHQRIMKEKANGRQIRFEVSDSGTETGLLSNIANNFFGTSSPTESNETETAVVMGSVDTSSSEPESVFNTSGTNRSETAVFGSERFSGTEPESVNLPRNRSHSVISTAQSVRPSRSESVAFSLPYSVVMTAQSDDIPHSVIIADTTETETETSVTNSYSTPFESESTYSETVLHGASESETETVMYMSG